MSKHSLEDIKLFDIPKKEEAIIKPDDRTFRRKFTDNLIGSIKAQLQGKEKPSPLLVYPAAAAVATAVANPITTITQGIKGLAKAKLIDYLSKSITGKDFKKIISDTFDINEDFAEIFNPGYYNNSKINNVKSLLPKLNKNNNVKSLKTITANTVNNNQQPNVSKAIANPIKNRIELQNVKGLNKINYGNKVNLSSANNVIYLTDFNIPKRRTLLKRINKIFNIRYGYPSISLDASINRESTEAAIKDLMTQHNTFVRGVRDEKQFIDGTNKKLIELGLEPTSENRLRYYAQRYAPDTGHGRYGFNESSDKNLGTIYTSNMMSVANGYGLPREPGQRTGVYIVRRPLDFSSSNLEDWVSNNDFRFNGLGDTKTGRDYFKYNLPYYLKTGKTLTREYLEENPFKPNVDLNEFNRNYYGTYNSRIKENLYRASGIKRLSGFELPQSRIDYSPEANALHKIELKTFDYAKDYDRSIKDKIRKKYYKKYPNIDMDNSMTYVNNKLDYNATTDIFYPVYKQNYTNEQLYQIKRELDDELKTALDNKYNAVKGYYYGSLKQMPKIIKTEKDRYDNALKALYKKEYLQHIKKIDIDDYASKKGITPTQQRNIIIGEGKHNNATINSKYKPIQHFVFVGNIGDKGLDIVRKVPYNEAIKYGNQQGSHYGSWTEGLSRKAKKYGGKISLEDI